MVQYDDVGGEEKVRWRRDSHRQVEDVSKLCGVCD